MCTPLVCTAPPVRRGVRHTKNKYARSRSGYETQAKQWWRRETGPSGFYYIFSSSTSWSSSSYLSSPSFQKQSFFSWWWFLLFLYTPVSAGLNQLDEKRLRCCCGSAAAFLIFCGFFFILEVHNPINGRPTLREVPKRPRSFSPRMCVCVLPLRPLGSLRALQETAKGWIIPTRNDRGNNGDDGCP